jgi:hypothetical protein
MALISDIIYHIEITDNKDDLDLTITDTLKITSYLINNLQDNHQMPGSVYLQFIGILDWHKEHHFITDKQHYWLLDHLWQYIDQRQYTYEEML